MTNIEYKVNQTFPVFINKVKTENKKIFIICDLNTLKYVENIRDLFDDNKIYHEVLILNDHDLVPNEEAIYYIEKNIKSNNYILAVGTGTLNDLSKYVSFKYNIECGVYPTAPSMDGFCTKGAAIIENNFKKSYDTHTPSDVLIDLDVIATAPKLMVASGVGDILGKYTALMDWYLSSMVNNEEYNVQAVELMRKATDDCISNIDKIKVLDKEGIKYLMDALITSGLAMQLASSSRPASGSEHHMSHYLEMEFIKNNEIVPLHGLKVGLGTLISLELYKKLSLEINNKEIINEINKLPSVWFVKGVLADVGAYTKFSDIDISQELMREMILNSYKVRNRFTILTYLTEKKILDKYVDELIEKYY